MKRFWICIVLAFLLMLVGAVAHAKPRTSYSYGLPRMQHRRQTVKPYRLQTPRKQWSPCRKHKQRKVRGFDLANPEVYLDECFVQ